VKHETGDVKEEEKQIPPLPCGMTTKSGGNPKRVHSNALSSNALEREAAELERLRCHGCSADWIGGIRQSLIIGRKTPDVAVAQIDNNLSEDLPPVVGRAQEVDSGLDEDVIAGYLSLNRCGRIKGAEDKSGE